MQPINYLLSGQSPFEALMGGMDGFQKYDNNKLVLEQNRIANQAAQDKADYLKQAQQEAQTLDYNDPNAIRQFIAKYESTGLTKGMTDYVANLDTNERQGMLADTSKAISLLRSGDGANAAQFARDKALAYKNAGMASKAAEYEQMAAMMESHPDAALQSLQMNYAVLLPKDAASNYKSLIEAGAPQVKEFSAGGETGAWIRDPYTGEVTYQKLTDNSISPDEQLRANTSITNNTNDNETRVTTANIAADTSRYAADKSSETGRYVADRGYDGTVYKETAETSRFNAKQQNEMNQSEVKSIGGYLLRVYKSGRVDVIGKDTTATGANGQKPLTEAQSNAYLFGTRMEANHKILTDFESKGINGSIAQHLFGDNKATNFASRPEHQQYAQAKRDFINAVLRKESGAAIGKDEFASADKQYFPQIGDSPVVIQQKQQAREQAIKGIMAAVPQGFQGNYPAASAPPSSIAKPQQQGGYISGKYK